MIGTILIALTALMPQSAGKTLQVEGRLSGIEFLVAPGESTFALGALPGVKEKGGAVTLDFGDITSSVPVVFRKKIKLFLGREFASIILNLEMEFSDVEIVLPPADSVSITLISKFSSIEVKHSRTAYSLIDLFQVGGKSTFSGPRIREDGKLSLFVANVNVRSGVGNATYDIASEGANIFVPAGRTIIHRQGVFNSVDCETHSKAASVLMRITGSFNRVSCIREEL